MKTNLIMATVAVLMAATSYCQQSRFKITHSHNYNAEWAKSVVFADDTTMWVNLNHGPLTGGYGLMVLRINYNGTITTKKVYESSKHSYIGSWAGSMINLDTAIYIGGLYQWQDSVNISKGYSYPYIAKLNSHGDTIWIKHFEIDTSGYYQGTSFSKTSDGNLLLAGHVSYRYNNPGWYNLFLIKVDTAGNLLWQKTYGTISIDERLVSLEELSDSSIILGGMREYGSPSLTNYKPWILKLDKSGNVQASKQYNLPSMQYGGVMLKHAKNGDGYWMLGLSDSVQNPNDYAYYVFLARVDEQFNILRRKFFNSKWLTQMGDFHELDNGDVVFCGDKDDSATSNQFGYIARMDSLGNLKWWRTYHEFTGNNNYLSCIRPAPDGGFVAVGSTFSLPNGSSQDAWIIKTDSMGCLVANCFVGVNDVEQLIKGVKVYPNPVDDLITFEFSKSSNYQIEFFDRAGKRVRAKCGSEIKATFDVSDLAPGLYIYELTSDSDVYQGKFLKN